MKLSTRYLLLSALVLIIFYKNPTNLVFASGCSGTIYCGTTRYHCSLNFNYNCASVACPYGDGSCVSYCDQSTNPMSCYNILNEAQCDIANAANSCASGCSIAPDTPCTWIPPCTTTDWVDGACGNVNSCADDERQQTRTVNPSGCTNSVQCVSDSSCVAIVPSCTLSLTPTTVNPLLIGSTSTFTAALSNINDGTVSNVTFSSSNTGVRTI